MADDETSLKLLLQKHQETPVETLLPDELSLLIDSFRPSLNASVLARAMIFLSKFISEIRQKYSSQSDSNTATSVLVRTFSAPIESRLADTHESQTISALCFLTSLFQVDWATASEIFSRDGLLDIIIDIMDIYSLSQEIAVALATLLSQASGHKQCRTLVSSPIVMGWLKKGTNQTKTPALRAAAAVTLVKLSQGLEFDTQNNELGGIEPVSSKVLIGNNGVNDHLVKIMQNLVITEGAPSAPTLDAVEGIAYLSVQPQIKESISKDPAFLKRLMMLVPRRATGSSFSKSNIERTTDGNVAPAPNLGLYYGIVVIITNLCVYKPKLSDEERQIEKLRRMTKVPNAEGKLSSSISSQSEIMLDDDDHVKERGKRLMKAGVVDALTGIIKQLGGESGQRSIATQRVVAKAMLNLVEDKTNRGLVLQGGSSRALLTIIRTSIASIDPINGKSRDGVNEIDPIDLVAIQALAKLSITSPPSAVFGPGQDSFVDAIRPFAILLTHSSASQLQRFESVMALTNIASVSPEAAERISAFHLIGNPEINTNVGDIVKYTEGLLLDSNTLLRRSAAELVCNLVGGAEGSFDYFGGTRENNVKLRLQVLVALSDVEDLPTRLAASGALATLTASPQTCQNLAKLELERHRVLPTLVELISPEIAQEYREERPEDESATAEEIAGDPGLVHRGIVCVRNLFANIDGTEERKTMSLEAEKRGLIRALVQVIKTSPSGQDAGVVLRPAAEVLKWIALSGVKLPI